MDHAETPENNAPVEAAAPEQPPVQPAAEADAPMPVVTEDHAEDEALDELDLIKGAVLDSAELATRAASLATNAGTDMRQATELMVKAQGKQRKQNMILLITSGTLMLISACVFIGISISLTSRLKMVDAMLLAVGKRVTELNSTMETVASANEALHTLAEHQEENKKLQDKLESSMVELTKSTQGLPEAASKQIDERMQTLVKQVQAMDSRLQTQGASLQRLTQQMQTLQGQVAESGQKLRSEVENMNRQQRERLSAEQAASKAAAATAPTAPKPKERDQTLQYPRVPAPGTGAALPGPGGSTRP